MNGGNKMINKILNKILNKKKAMQNFPECVKIQTTIDTLDKCKTIILSKQKGAYLRFGDGDLNLLENRDEMIQKSNRKLALEMKEAFNLSGNGILKCLPLHSLKFGMEDGMKPGVHLGSNEWAENILRRCYEYFVGDKIYSAVALAYLAVFNRDYTVDFLKTLRNYNPIFVGNENIDTEVIKSLFGQTVHIKTKSDNAFDTIDDVEIRTCEAIKSRKESYQIIVLAMGCSGRVLQKRLLLNKDNGDVFIFDFGSLMDAFCNWNTRAWIELANLPSNYWTDIVKEVKEG